MDTDTDTEAFETWAVVELMGHVRVAGRLTEESRFGTALGRIDIPTGDTEFVTQYFGGSSVYRITPCSEAAARQVARYAGPQPIYRLELTERAQPINVPDDDDEEEPW